MDFNFTSADQRAVLKYLQDNNYKLCGFKGASGPGQVSEGLPCWFAEPFSYMFGNVEIDYTPTYKIYVFNQAVIGSNTTIRMDILSQAIPLGSALTFNQDGSFSVSGGGRDGYLILNNNTKPGTPNVTIGLAALVGNQYLPFCAFTSTPQSSTSMQPHETVCLFAAQTSMTSGSVTAVSAAPGASFEFSAVYMNYELAFSTDGTYTVVSAPGGLPVTYVPANDNLAQLLNS